MKYLWKANCWIANLLRLNEVNLFAFLSTIVCACLFLAGFVIVAQVLGWGLSATFGVTGLTVILSGADIGLFGSAFWMLRNDC